MQNHYDDHFYLQINRNDEWEDLLNSFGIEEATANGSLALKQTYLRYLDPYEKVHFLGEEEDRDDDWVDEEDSRFVHVPQYKQSLRKMEKLLLKAMPFWLDMNEFSVWKQFSVQSQNHARLKDDAFALPLAII